MGSLAEVQLHLVAWMLAFGAGGHGGPPSAESKFFALAIGLLLIGGGTWSAVRIWVGRNQRNEGGSAFWSNRRTGVKKRMSRLARAGLALAAMIVGLLLSVSGFGVSLPKSIALPAMLAAMALIVGARIHDFLADTEDH